MVRLRLDMVLSLNVNRKFTIHYGEIKTQGKGYQAIATYLFTIHYGEIKTSSSAITVSKSPYLQSTMVRLRRIA